MKTSLRLFWPAVLAFVLAAGCFMLMTGCKGTLQEGGAYAPIGENADMAFYVVDASFDVAYSAVDAAFKFERDNRKALWAIDPNIKRTLDKIRPEASDILVRYSRARVAYLKTPNPSGMCELQAALTTIQKVSSAAIAAIPKGQ